MIGIYDYSSDNELDLEFSLKTIEIIKKTIEEKPCCNSFPNCNHARYQTNKSLLDENNYLLSKIKSTFIQSLNNYLNRPFSFSYFTSWAFMTKAGTKTDHFWHEHEKDKVKTDEHISGIFYLNESSIGTEYENDDIRIIVKPKRFKWYLWPSNLLHKPMEGTPDEDRFTIATSVGVNYPVNSNDTLHNIGTTY